MLFQLTPLTRVARCILKNIMGQYSGWAYTFYSEISGILVLARRCSGVNGYVLEKYFKERKKRYVFYFSVFVISKFKVCLHFFSGGIMWFNK